jgi:hypothetical protein
MKPEDVLAHPALVLTEAQRAAYFSDGFLLASPGFWRNLGSGSEAECLHLIGILAFADEFREAVACG